MQKTSSQIANEVLSKLAAPRSLPNFGKARVKPVAPVTSKAAPTGRPLDKSVNPSNVAKGVLAGVPLVAAGAVAAAS